LKRTTSETPKRSATQNLPFGESQVAEKRASANYFVLSSSFTVPLLLARGAMIAPGGGESSGLGWLDDWTHSFPARDESVPPEWVAQIVSAARNSFPILLRCHERRHVVITTATGESEAIEAILLADVDAVVFRSEAERKRFASWGFANVPDIDGAATYKVDETPFAGSTFADPNFPVDASGRTPVDAPVTENDNDRRVNALRRADALCALLAVVITSSGALHEWIRELQELSAERTTPLAQAQSLAFCKTLVTLLSGEPTANDDLDTALLGVTIGVLLRHQTEDGWPASEILDEIDTEMTKKLGSSLSAVDELTLWVTHCRDVIAARTAPPALSDDKSIVRRAVLLLLLRGTVEELAEVPSDGRTSGVSAGPNVKLLALSLAAIRTGFRRLPAEFKRTGDKEKTVDLRNALGALFLSDYERRLSQANWRVAEPIRVDYHRRGVLEGDWHIRIGELPAITIETRYRDSVKQVWLLTKNLGYMAIDDGFDGFTLAEDTKGRLTLPVRVTVLSAGRSDEERVRLECEIPSKATVTKAKGKKVKVKAASSMPKEFFVGLLKELLAPTSHHAYALSGDGVHLYAVTELPITQLDEHAFRRRVSDVMTSALRHEIG